MVPDPRAWNEDYWRRGLLWSGNTHELPDLPLYSRVLELGCGNGKTLSAMIQRRWDVTAIDFSYQAAKLSQEVERITTFGNILVADATVPPFKDETFDAVFAFHVIGHMHKTDRERITKVLAHILKPDGILFFSDFSTDDFRFGKGAETEPATFTRSPGIITHYFTQEEIISLFSNFTLVSIRIHQWPMRVLESIFVRSEIHATFTRK